MLLAFSVSVSVFRDCPLMLNQVRYHSVLDLLGMRHILSPGRSQSKMMGAAEFLVYQGKLKKFKKRIPLARDVIFIFSEPRAAPRSALFGRAATTSADFLFEYLQILASSKISNLDNFR